MRVKGATPNLLAEPRSAGDEETWNTLVTNFLSEDHAVGSAAGVDAVLASATLGEDGYAPLWRQDDKYASEGLFDISLRRAPGPGNDCKRFSQQQSMIHTNIGREEFSEKRNGSLLAENSRRTGRVTARVLAAFLAIELRRIGGNVSAGLSRNDMEEAHHRKSYATVVAAAGGGQPRGEAV